MTIIAAILIFLVFFIITALAIRGITVLFDRSVSSEGFISDLYLVLSIVCSGIAGLSLLMIFFTPVLFLVGGAL